MRVEQQQNVNIAEFIQQAADTGEADGTVLFQDKITAKSNEKAGNVSVNMKDATYLKPDAKEKKTATEEIEEAGAMDARERKNQMTVLSNTTSEEDYAKMQDDGFSLDNTTSNTIVTVTDKIKAELAKAGVDISCFGDDLTQDQIEAIAGNPELAAQIAGALQQADLPVTKDNMKESAEAYSQAEALNAPGEGAVKYLLDNGLEPTIENLYKAEYSGSSSYHQSRTEDIDISSFISQIEAVIKESGCEVTQETLDDSRFLLGNDIPLTPDNLIYLQELKNMNFPLEPQEILNGIATAVTEGKRPKDALLIPEHSMQAQAEHAAEVVKQAVDEDLQYIIEQGMELTIENLEIAADNRTGGQQVKEAEISKEGKQPENDGVRDAAAQTGAADYSKETSSESVLRHAEESGEYTHAGLELLSARRQLEEARLAMTAQANYALLKQGISIDTEPLVKLVEELKVMENRYYANLLSEEGVEPNESNVALFRETTEKAVEIRSVPAYVLGMKEAEKSTIPAVHEAGSALKEKFEKANERYETLMTAPKEELGDSIQKAFRNTDDILMDLGMEASAENRRAIRILGYNGLDITRESVMQMKAADEEVQRVFKNLTPAVVTQMIKRGMNPLEMDFTSLNAVIDQVKRETEETDQQKFSEYLWKLEQNHAISEEERSSYIGIYRLIHQVERTDGAAVGALVNQGAELTMKNLLTAARSERRSGKMDYSVDEEFGTIERSKEFTITDQIEAAYQTNCVKDISDTITPEKMRQVMQEIPNWEDMTPEQLKEALKQTRGDEAGLDAAYAREQLANLASSADAAQDVYEMLERYQIPNTMVNIMAMESMTKNRNLMFRQIFGSGVKDADEEVGTEDLEQIRQELIEEFGEAVTTPEDMAVAQEKLGELAENVMKTMINSENVTSLDVREMKLLSAKLSISSILAKEEQYSVPVMVNDEMMNVSLKIVRGVDKKGIVDIMMESELRGKIAATFQAKEKGISGFIATNSRETKGLLESNMGAMMEQLAENTDLKMEAEFQTDVHCAYISDLDLNHFSGGNQTKEAVSATEENKETESYKIQTVRLYHIAESFIKSMKGML